MKLVELLDDLNELDDTQLLIKAMNNIDISKMEEYKQKTKNNALSILDSDYVSIKEKYQKTIISLVKSINENEELRKKFSESVAQSIDILNLQ
jgi:hypothetical protein